MKELKIDIPEGFEIDKENSNIEEGIIKFKLIADKTKELYDYLNNYSENMVMKTDYINQKITFCTTEILKKETHDYNNYNECWLFQQDLINNKLWVRGSIIWKVIGSKLNFNHDQIRNFIKDWVDVQFGWRGFTIDWNEYFHEFDKK